MMEEQRSAAAPPRPAGAAAFVGITATLAGLLAVFAGGYWVYTHIVGRLLLQAQGASILPTGLILALAVLAGAASFFSPCSLAITPAFLTYFVENDARQGITPSGRRLFSAAFFIAIGIVGVSAVAGVLVGAIGAVVYNILLYLIPLVGAVFVALGVMMLLGRGARLSHAARYLPGRHYYEHLLSEGRSNSRGELIGFGVAYGAASHSCTLPVVIGLLMLPVAAGNYWLAGIAVLIYGVSLAGLMLLMLTLGQPTLAAMRRWTGPSLSYIVGGLFLATGFYLFYYAVLSGFLAVGTAQTAGAVAPTPSSSVAQVVSALTSPGAAMPVFKLVEGAQGSPDPYTPRVLDIPVGRQVALDITDNIGGCQTVTTFPGLGPDGATTSTNVPVGQTRRIVIAAAKPGRYRYHCAGNMYFGEIVAR